MVCGSHGVRQLGAVLRKNALVKRRNLKLTFCELLSPPLFIGILVLGYFLTDPDYFTATIYVRLQVSLNPLLQILFDVVSPLLPSGLALSDGGSVDLFDLRDNFLPLIDGPLPALPVELFGAVGQAARETLGSENLKRLTEEDSYGAFFGNILTLGVLHVAPNTSAVRDFVSYARSRYAIFTEESMRIHESEDAALDALLKTRRNEVTWGLITFNSLSPTDVDYAIRLNYTTVPNTNQIVNTIAKGLDRTYQRYHLSGFLTLQRLVDSYAFGLASASGYAPRLAPAEETAFAPFPTASFDQNIFYFAVQFLLGIILSMCLLLPVSTLTKAVVEEKEQRLKQTMRIMGLRHWVFVAAWYSTAALQFTVIAVLCTIVSTIFLESTGFLMIFIYVSLFCASSVSFAMLITVFFSNAILAAIVAPLAFFACVLPKYVFFGTNRYEAATGKRLASLVAPTAFAFGAEILGDYEYAGFGVTTDNWGEGDYSFQTCLQMLFIDCLLYTVLYLYLERVLPSRYGARLHPLFFAKPSFWWPSRYAARASHERAVHPTGFAFEPVDNALRSQPSVEIVNLKKVYGSGRMKKVAVDGLNLSMYAGQITCLLGHNGAGKTTTLSVLTGLYPPTSGDCYVFGYSIKHAMNKVYTLLGICPQHDVLWKSLTVTEHLSLYATLKGVPPSEHKTAVGQMLTAIGLHDKAHARSAALSGGMKRKLSVGCSLIGGSKAVLLDEPTSGMDPASRRSLWDLLKSSAPQRVLVLTTHYMDEADLLADRIAVMSQGTLRCVGSSIFLKARFGLGYTLTMVKADGRCKEETVSAAVRQFVPNAQLLSKSGAELTYRLAFASAKLFPPLLRYLDAHQQELRVHGYGMSVTSMEEVFLQLSRGGTDGANAESEKTETWAPITPSACERQVVEVQASSQSQSKRSSLRSPSACGVPKDARFSAPKPYATEVPARDPVARKDSFQIMHHLSDRKEGVASKTIDNDDQSQGRHADTMNKSSSGGTGGSGGSTGEESGGGEGNSGKKTSSGEVALPIETPDVVAPSRGQASVLKQLRVLLRKRWQCGRRDKKGFITQQILPVALIGLVLLVLTISDPLVGPAVVLDASLFLEVSNEGSIFPHNLGESSPIISSMEGPGLSPRSFGYADSDAFSEYLLDTYNDRKADSLRLVTLVANDTLAVNVSIDVDKLQRNLAPNTVNGAILAGTAALITCAATDTFNVDVEAIGGVLVDLNLTEISGDISDAISDINVTDVVGDVRDGINGANVTDVVDTVTETVDQTTDDVNNLIDGDVDANSTTTNTSYNATMPPLTPPTAPPTAPPTTTPAPPASARRRAQSSVAPTLPPTAPPPSSPPSPPPPPPPPPLPPIVGTIASLFPGVDEETAAALDDIAGVQLSLNQTDLLLTQLEVVLVDLQDGQVDGTVRVDLAPIIASLDEADNEDVTVAAQAYEQVCELAGSVVTASDGNGTERVVRVNGQRVSAFVPALAADSIGRIGADASRRVFPLSAQPLLDVLPPVPAWARVILEQPGGPDSFLGQAEIALLSSERRQQLELLRTYYRFLVALEDFEEGEPLTLSEFAGRRFALDDVISVNGEPLALPFVNGWTITQLAFMFDAIFLTQTNVVVNGINVNATANPPNATSVPLQLRIGRLTSSSGVFVATGITLDAERFGVFQVPDIYARSNDTEFRAYEFSIPTRYTLLTNASSPHAIAAYLGELTRASWREMHASRGGVTQGDAVGSEFNYVVRNQPLPLTAEQELQARLVLAFLAGLFVIIPFCFIPATVAAFVVKERVCKAKHLQLVSGTKVSVYWLATYLWDVGMFLLVTVGIMLVFLAYNEPAFVGSTEQALATALLILVYGVSTIPLSYCYSFLFTSSATAQIGIILFNLISGFVCVIAHQVMQALPNTKDADAVLVNFYKLLPPYNFGEALLKLAQGWYFAQLDGTTPTPLSDVKQALWVMPLEGVLFFLILGVLENPQTFHFVAMRVAKLLCGAANASLSCTRRSKIGCGACSCLAFVIIVIGITAFGGGGTAERTALNSGSDGRSTQQSSSQTGSESESGTLGGVFLIVLALLILLFSAVFCVLYERRVRRRGGTMEAKALHALADGKSYVPDDDVAAEKELVQRLIKKHTRDNGNGGDDDEHVHHTPRRWDRFLKLRSKLSSAKIGFGHVEGVKELEMGAGDDGNGNGDEFIGDDNGKEDALPVVLINKLEKIYPSRGQAPPKVALVDLSLHVPHMECFGFLGVNGAGKSTTMSILTGDALPTSGDAWISGYDVVSQLHSVREQIGYCPQHDPLLELMTAREMLTMFARIKNIDEARIAAAVSELIEHVTLTPYADRVCGSYSGGNKRKLSLAIALVGAPAVVFLDEPSSGMDPVSRRKMWDIITVERERRSIVLTTHSMEECEALCTRIGIMTGGRFRCLGSQQRLKSKFGGGYTLEMRCDVARCNLTKRAVPAAIEGAVLIDEHAGKLKFQLSKMNTVPLAEVFECMEARKEEWGILDYSASQPTLESIFLSIVASQGQQLSAEALSPTDSPATTPTRPTAAVTSTSNKSVFSATSSQRRFIDDEAKPVSHA